MKKNIVRLLEIVLAIALILSACGTNPVNTYHGLIESYQAAQKAAATGRSCFALTGQQMNVQIGIYNSYLVADVTKTQVYRDALKTAQTQVNDANKAYLGPDGQPLPADQLDLATLAQQNATPASMAGGFTLMVNAFKEAPLAPVDPSVLANTQRIVSELFNQAMSCVVDWNDAVETYNVERNKIPGDVVGRLAEYLGVKELPQNLPYYEPPTSTDIFSTTPPTPAFPTP